MKIFINKIKKELINNYKIPENELDILLSPFYELVEEHPEIALYQSPIDWARELVDDTELRKRHSKRF